MVGFNWLKQIGQFQIREALSLFIADLTGDREQSEQEFTQPVYLLFTADFSLDEAMTIQLNGLVEARKLCGFGVYSSESFLASMAEASQLAIVQIGAASVLEEEKNWQIKQDQVRAKVCVRQFVDSLNREDFSGFIQIFEELKDRSYLYLKAAYSDFIKARDEVKTAGSQKRVEDKENLRKLILVLVAMGADSSRKIAQEEEGIRPARSFLGFNSSTSLAKALDGFKQLQEETQQTLAAFCRTPEGLQYFVQDCDFDFTKVKASKIQMPKREEGIDKQKEMAASRRQNLSDRTGTLFAALQLAEEVEEKGSVHSTDENLP